MAVATRFSDAVSWLSGQRAAMESFLERLVAQSSFTWNRRGVEAVANLAAGQLRALALDVELRASPRFGPHVLFSNKAPGAPVYLVGHTDIVRPPGGEGWRREGDRAVGPGAYDMKGGIAVMLFGLAGAKRAQLLERVPLRGMLLADEEAGAPESQALLRAHAAGASAGLSFEPGRPGDLIVTTRNGGGSLDAVARGIEAHAATEPERGRSAIGALARFIDRALGLGDPSRGLRVNVGTVSGGTIRATVPAEARCELDLRFERAEDGQALLEGLQAIAAESSQPGTSLELTTVSWRDPLGRTPAASALAKAYGECQRDCGLGMGEAPLLGGASPACTLGALGIPVIDGLGARGRGFESPREEIVDLSSLAPKAVALLRFLGQRVAA
jgi:glutamate carboxypeptidase